MPASDGSASIDVAGGMTGQGGLGGQGGGSGQGGVSGHGGVSGQGGAATGGSLSGGDAGAGAGGATLGGAGEGGGGAAGADAGTGDGRGAKADAASDLLSATDVASRVDAATICPSSPPSAGENCAVASQACFYEDCSTFGRTQVTCTAGKWVVQNGACGGVICLGIGSSGHTCPAGQVCLVRAGGALLVSCIANPCGAGPQSSDCSTMTTGCTPQFNVSSGVTYYCNTCPSGTCA